MNCLQLPPILPVCVLSLYAPPAFDVPLLPHPAGAAVDPAAHSANHSAFVASISHLALEQHPLQPVNLIRAEVEEELHAEQQYQQMAKEQVEVGVVEGMEKEEEAWEQPIYLT
jgi:hypothetical protein